MACFALFPRTLLYCSNCGEFVGTERITGLICSRKSGGCEGISIFHGSAARRAHGSSAERRRKIGAPAEAQRSGFGGVRRSKGANAVFAVGRNEVERTLRRRNRVKCTIARPKEVPLGEDGSHTARQNGPKHYPGDPTGAANRGPAKAQRKWVWWGEEEQRND